MKTYNNATVDNTAEEAIVQFLAGCFNAVAYMVPEDVRHNLHAASSGGFDLEDRTYKASMINYLLSRSSLIFVGLLSNEEFRQAFIESIVMEQNLEDQTPALQAEMREDMNSVKMKNDNNAKVVIDFSKYDDEVFKKINGKLYDSFKKLDGYDAVINKMINHQTTQCKKDYGFIVSNFAYLLRAFERNTVFLAYVSSVLESVKQDMNLSMDGNALSFA